MQNSTPEKLPWYKTWVFWATIYGVIILLYNLAFYFLDPEKKVLLTSNELGDFLAGAFAPLAFLFLYLGYKQQGDALNKSNQKLSEQLAQQDRLIRIQENEINAKHFSVRPHLSFKAMDVSAQSYQKGIYENGVTVDIDDEVMLYLSIKFKMTCESNTAKFIKVIDIAHNAVLYEYVELEKTEFKLISFMLEENEILELIDLDKDGELSLILAIEYFDIYGKQYIQRLKLTIPDFDWSHALSLRIKVLNDQNHPTEPAQSS
ncbi:MAG: hypothetical protein AB1706_07040 [Pseudomonadota bacterium]|uniref:hypothetical protein n=1 Tax=Acinetobacter pittii TaxID=48296 RepID=UPI0025AEE29F|nr:hypothetical protein [Acinetobacter pittii]